MRLAGRSGGFTKDMLYDFTGLRWLLAVIAIFPGVVCWWRGRVLMRAIADPALPERLLAAQRRNGLVVGPAIAILIFLAPWSALWSVPLLFAAQMVGAYPLRKVLYEETWTLAGYLWFMARFTGALWGFWIALALLPLACRRAEPYALPVGLAMGALLAAWNYRYGDVLQVLLGATPLEDKTLLERFTALAARSTASAPRFQQIDVGGGAIANAVALPSLRQSAVVFTKALLVRLDADESTAICAHEIAHLEHYNPRLLRKLNGAVHVLIVIGIGLALLPRILPPWSGLMAILVWVLGLAAFTAWRAHDRQAQETASDQRAVALCGNADALIRALTKIHAYSRFPRRFDAEWERHATHPSLARRLRDIREIAGTVPAALGAASSFAAVDGRTTVTFENERLLWSEGDVASHSLAYGYLSELRLDASARGNASLVAVERGGRRWQMFLAAGDVARLQAVLDVVDARLANPPAAPSRMPELVRMTLAFAVILALSLGQFGMAVAGMIAAFRPASPLLAGAGVASLAAAWLSFRSSDIPGVDIQIWLALLLVAAGVALLYLSRRSTNEPLPRGSGLALAGLAVYGGICTLLVLLNGLDPVDLHLSAIAFPSAAVLLLALATTLSCWPARGARAASVPAVALGLAMAAFGSTAFLDRAGRDPFLGPAEPIVWRTLQGEPQHEFTVDSYPSEIRLSPSGRSVMVTMFSQTHRRMRVLVGRPGGDLAGVDADQLVFADDDRVLAVHVDDYGAEVREILVDATDRIVWRQRVNGIFNPALSYRAAAREWRLIGSDKNGIVRAAGIVGEPGASTVHWMESPDDERMARTVAVSGASALVVQTQYTPLTSRGMLWMYLSVLQGLRTESIISRMTREGRSEIGVTRLRVHCVDTPLDDERLVCGAFDGTRTRFSALDPATGAITPLAMLTGEFMTSATLNGGWLSGWAEREAVAIRPATREGIRVPERGISLISASDGTLGTVSYGAKGPIVRIYELAPHVLRASGS